MPVLYVDSNHRSAGSPTDFTVELRDSLVIERHALVRLDQCRVPLSMYTVNDTNKYLYITESPSVDNIQPRLLTLAKQNYSGDELAAEVQKQLNSGGPFVQNRGAGYSVSYNANQGSLTILKLPSAKYPLITNDNKYLYIMSWSRVTLTNLFVAIELTPGPYTTSLLVEELQRKMNAAENPYGITNPWTVTYLENEGLIQVTPAPSVAGLADWCFVPDQNLATMDLTPFGLDVTSENPKSANRILGVTEMQLVSTWVSTKPLDLPDDPETFTVHTDEDLRSGKVILRRLAYQPEPMFTEDSCYMYGLWYNAATGKLQFPKFRMPVGIRTYDPPSLATDIAAVLDNTTTVFDTVAVGGVIRHVYTVTVLQSGKLLVASTDRTETNQLAFLDDETIECLATLPEIKKDTNDRLYLQCKLLDQSFAYGITLNPGIYTIGQLVVELDRALNAASTVFKSASIPRPFIVTANSGFLKLSLSNEVPNSVYSDSSTLRIQTNVNDKLYLRCSFGFLDYHYLITVPPGVYTSGQWCAMLEDKLNAATTVFASANNPRPFTAFKYLGKIRVVVTGPSPANSKFTFFPDSYLTPQMLATFQVSERQSANFVMGNSLFSDTSLTWTANDVYMEPARKLSLVPDNVLNYPQVSHINYEVNDRLYLMCAISGTTYKYGLYLPPGIYTSGEFAVMLEDILNARQTVFASTLVPRPWSVIKQDGKIKVLLVTYAQTWSFTFLTDAFLAQSPLSLLQQTWFNDVTPTNLRSANSILGNITGAQGMVVTWLAETAYVEPAIKHAPSDFFPLATYETLNSANDFIGNSFGLLGGVYTLDRTWMAARAYEEPVFTPRMLNLSLLLANITSNNNRLYFQMTYATSLSKYLLITLPPGWYTIERFAAFLQAYLNSAQTPYNKPGRVDPFQVRATGGFISIYVAESTTDPMDSTERLGIFPDSYFPEAVRRGLDLTLLFGVTVDPANPKTCNAVMGNTNTVYSRYRGTFFAWEPFRGPPPITPEWWCNSLKDYQLEWAPQTALEPSSCNAQLGNTQLAVTGRTWISASPISIPQMTYDDTKEWLTYANDASSDQPRSFNRNLHHPGGHPEYWHLLHLQVREPAD